MALARVGGSGPGEELGQSVGRGRLGSGAEWARVEREGCGHAVLMAHLMLMLG